MSSHAQTHDGDNPKIDEEDEETGISLLRRGYEDRSASLVSSAVSKHGSKSYGAKTLSEIRDSVDKTCETGTALINLSQIAPFAPSILLYPDGPFEVLSPGLMRGCMFTDKPRILVHRTLQSLDGIPTPLSEADYQSLEHAVKSEKVASENRGENTIAPGYGNVLNALETARVTQLQDGDGENNAMFELDLSSVPHSMQFRKSGLSVNEEPGIELASWAWDKMSQIHGEGPSNGVTIVKLEEDFKSEHPLTFKNPLFFNSRKTRERLTARFRRMEEVLRSDHEIEFTCVLDTTPVARHTRLDFTPHDDDFSVRFQRTAKHCVDHEQWMHDTHLLAIVKNRDLSKMETHALIPSRHLENYTRATNDKLSLSAYHKKDYVSRRPSDYFQVDDRDFHQWRYEFFATHKQGESVQRSTLPREGHESLLKDVALISEGKGSEVSSRRYGEKKDDGAPHGDTIAEYYGKVDPLLHCLKKTHRDAPFDAVRLENSMTPAAFDRWTEVQADQVGTPAEGQDVLVFRDWVNQNI
ncbi:hypothetical protein B9479_007339 [Cryptococcus floricola]|uniref:Uncharacterized protein n=1 Tax=Cryptococcus floricola TaxID=2591691 RepID=A0A5D3AMQ9_9TREE|nr:hypothetical protein B9479_007339 [Cryptococcus floricola]